MNISTKKTPRRTKILISPVWSKILNIWDIFFELIQIEVRLKICDSHLTCKIAHKCLNVRERVEVVEWNRKKSPPFPYCPVSCQCPWKKPLIEKKKKIEVQCTKNYFNFFLPPEAGTFGNNIEKKPQKPRSKSKKYVYCIFTENICSAFYPMEVVDICKNALILYNNDSYFLILKLA